ncbi:MAG: hypothetical protein H6624_00515 [Bdellovibrionaceae bacterium]|nr:hypothetical protein [Bdellovibrionales bacterium]MCB9082790.1 hypothetical protein [Pseudobdellovibrionaceae bacterium]
MNKSYRIFLLSALVLLAAASRWLPHPPNFTPLMAMALFAGALFRDLRWALVVPALGMLISDFGLGFHDQMLPVYVSLIAGVGIGRWVGSKGEGAAPLAKRLPFGILSSSLVFFTLSNFFVWAFAGLYPRTGAGLVQSYVMAIPFFHNELLGNLFYSGVLFAIWAAAKKFAPAEWTEAVRG